MLHFADRHGATLAALGWGFDEVFGAPAHWARLDHRGIGWFVRGGRIVHADAASIKIRAGGRALHPRSTGARMNRAASSALAPHELARDLRRPWFDMRRPHLFLARRDELADAVARLGNAPPRPFACAAPGLRRELARAAARAVLAERLLASVRPRPRRKLACDQRQMLLSLDA